MAIPVGALALAIIDLIVTIVEVLPTLNISEENKLDMLKRCKAALNNVVIPPEL